MLDLYKNKFKKIEVAVGRFFSLFPVSPNQYTLISLLFAFIALYFLIRQNLILALVFFLIAGFLDFVDGAVARYKNISTKIGAYLDTIVDRYVEGLLLLGMLFLPLPEILLPGYIWVFLILFGAIITTYAKAAAKEKELVSHELKGGLLSRGERITLLLIALILGIAEPSLTLMTSSLILIALLANFTAIQRIFSALRFNKSQFL